ITMMHRQAGGADGVGAHHGDAVELLVRQHTEQIVRGLELAELSLDLELPDGRGRDKDLVGRIGDRSARGPVERRIVAKPPDQRVSVEDEDQRSKSRVMSSFGASKSAAMVI